MLQMTKKQATESFCGGGPAARRRGRPVQMDMAAREERILEAASSLLTEGGFDHVTMAAIARRAGMSKRTLYEHFESHEALLGSVISRMGERIFRPLRTEDEGRSLTERLQILLTLNKPPGAENSKLEFLRTLIARAQTYPTLSRQLLENGRGRLIGHVSEELARASKAGEIELAADSAALAAEMLVNLTFEDPVPRLLLCVECDPSPEEMAQRRDLAISLFLHGCGAKNLGVSD